MTLFSVGGAVAALVTSVCPSSWVTDAFINMVQCRVSTDSAQATTACTALPLPSAFWVRQDWSGPNLKHVDGTSLLLKAEYSYFV